MKALILDAEARTAHLRDISQPQPKDGEVLVQVHAISLNPIDPLYVAKPLARSGRVIGSDFAGIISKIGRGVPPERNLVPGDHVAGFLQGACSVNERPGAFAEYVAVPYDLLYDVPDDVMSLEAASGVSLVSLTAAQVVWYRLGLPCPFSFDRAAALAEHLEWSAENETPQQLNFLIYGASTSVGLFAAQMVWLSAKASSKTVKLYGVASKAGWNMLKSEPYHYDHLVDYRDFDWPEQIVKLSNGAKMHYVYDCISEGASVQRAANTLADAGKMAIMRSRQAGAWQADSLPIDPIYGAVWEGLGEEIQYSGFTVPKSSAARAFAVEFFKWLSEAIGTKIQPVPIRMMPGGFEQVVEDGFVLLGPGKMEDRQSNRSEEYMRPVRAEKLVYKIR